MGLGRVVLRLRMMFKDFVHYSLFYEHKLLLMRVKERIGNVNFVIGYIMKQNSG